MALNLKVEGSTLPRGMCFSFLLAFACKVVRVLLEGKCIASLQEDPAEDSLFLACFYCATTVQGLELDLRFCDGKLDCFFCCTASPYLPLDTFLSRERARSFKKGPTATSAQTFTFFQALDPFLRPERPTSSKKGATATSAQTFAFFSRRWTPFWAVSGRDFPKRGPPPHQLRFFNFDVAGPLFEAWEAGILHKGELQPDVKLGGFNLLFLWRRESALLLCKRIPLRHYNARAWTWPPLLWRETGLLLLLIGFSLSTAGPLFQPWAAEILERGAPQPDVKRATIWFFSVPLPRTEAVPPSALSVPALCACRLVRVAFFSQIPFPKHCSESALPSTPFTPGWPSSVGKADSS